jgi:hypothetical protein
MKFRFASVTPFVLAIALLPTLLNAQDAKADPAHANFSGRWRMDKERSSFAKFKMPDLVVRVIDQHDPTMNVHTVQTSGQRTSTVDVTYYTDGSPSSNVVNGREATSKSFWDGNALVVRTDMKTAKNEDEQIEDRYELSEDGKTLTTTSHVVTSKGDVTMTMVCAKESTH